MNTTTTANVVALAGVDIYKKTPAQIMALMVKKNDQATTAVIQLCVMAYVLIIENSYKVKEAADNLEMTEATVRGYSEKGRVLALAANATNSEKMFKQLGAFSMDELRTLSADILNEENRAEYVQYRSVRAGAASRLGDSGTPETIDILTSALIELGAVTPAQIRKQVADVATALGIKLPAVTRTPKPGDKPEEKVAKTSAALATLEKFEADREEGSEGADVGFALTDEETADLVKSAQTIIRTLRQANRFEAIAEVGIFLDESIELTNA
jgi:hypothetical protein